MRSAASILLFFCCLHTHAQSNRAIIEGNVVDEQDSVLKNIAITILGKTSSTLTNDSGFFSVVVPANKALALVFSGNGYASIQKNFNLSKDEKVFVYISMKSARQDLEQVTLTSTRQREESGLISLDPRNSVLNPSPVGGVESMIKTLVGSNNELSSQYNVRGGNYDENSIYINDFEVYRPYLVSNGQQEGLSFIHPELTRSIQFYTGGFQAKYGDKMSSVLDIRYRKPTAFSGGFLISPLEQGIHLSGISRNRKWTYLTGWRNRSNNNLLRSQPTSGSYIPAASDFQSLITWTASNRFSVEWLSILSGSRFTFYPAFSQKTSSVFTPLYAANIGLDTYFEGQERDRYRSGINGLSLSYNIRSNHSVKLLLSHYFDREEENYDITGSYLFGERDFDNTSATFGEIVNPLGAGVYQQYARNRLAIDIGSAGIRGQHTMGKQFIQWGLQAESMRIRDDVSEFEYRDSAGYSLPYQPGTLSLFTAIRGENERTIFRAQGFIQNNIRLTNSKRTWTIQGGLRWNGNNLNQEWLLSPRMQVSVKPTWKRDWIFRTAFGRYVQPPFYREFRRPDGRINPDVRAQKSWQWVAGADHQWKGPGNKPFRISAEWYYKHMTDVVPYDVENVRIRYWGENKATAYATGLDFRLYTELLKDAESWFSLGLMQTRENINNDQYTDYLNAAGEVITPNSIDPIIRDSVKRDIGFLRRPTDRLITVGLFLQDYLATNQNIKAYLHFIYGSNMPFNIPGSTRYRNGLTISPYIRVDVGFSARLLPEKANRRSHSPFRQMDNLWLSLEVFNLIDKANTISYQLIKDYSNNIFALPNRLTPRLLNLKLIGRF